jgi:DNA-binding transcriptional LysR family regulator
MFIMFIRAYDAWMQNPLAGLDVNLLVALDALLVAESVAPAARAIGLSPSAMSHALSRLRATLDDPILVRAGRRMTLTPRARALADPLRRGLSLLSSVVVPPAPFDPLRAEEVLRIAAIDFAQNQVVPPLLALLRRRAPRVDVAVASFEPAAFKELTTGDLHLVLGMARSDTAYPSQRLTTEDFVCVLRQDHPALRRRRLSPEAFASLPHVLISSKLRRAGAVDKALATRGLTRRVALVVPSFSAAAIAVSQSDMVLTGARREAERHAAAMPLALVPPPVPVPPFGLAMFWHERSESDPFHRWIREQVVQASAPPSAARGVR